MVEVIDLQGVLGLELELIHEGVNGGGVPEGAVLAVLGVEVHELALLEGVVLPDDLGEFCLLEVGLVGLPREDVAHQTLSTIVL